MEKLEKKHHDHKFTEWLKNIIFGLVMLAPMLAIAVRCGYVMWNKNAKESYSGAYATDTKLYINDSADLVYNENYYFTNPLLTETTSSTLTLALNVNNLINLNDNTNLSNIHVLRFVFQSNGYTTLQLRETLNGSNVTTYGLYNSIVSFNFDYVGILDGATNYTLITNCIYTLMYQGNTLDNAFSYGISQLSNDPIFNWTRNTGIYQPINAMVSGLEIENDTLQIMLAYWSLMTAVYIVFDLIIFCFTKLTHFING